MGWFKKSTTKKSKCNYEGGTGSCSLIQKLQLLQAEKREIDKEIGAYTSNSLDTVAQFISFLVELEKNGLFTLCRTTWLDNRSTGVQIHFQTHSTSVLEKSLKRFSSSDIQAFCDELKALSYKTDIVAEKRQISDKLAAEIKEIKDTLGIE